MQCILRSMQYEQMHPEGCLARCLMILLDHEGKKIKDTYERDLLISSLEYGRESFVKRHLEKAAHDFQLTVKWCVDSQIYLHFVKKLPLTRNVSLIHKKVTLRSIDELLDKPFILYVDRFHLWKREWGLYYRYHYPHFIVVTKRSGEKYRIIDPDDGKVRWIEARILSKAIISLRNHLHISPQIIRL